MTKSIYTLVPDIQHLLDRQDGWFTTDLANEFALSLAKRVQKQSSRVARAQKNLWMSQLGPRCPRALWYAYHHPELGEPLSPEAKLKYLYGDIIEGLVIALAKAAGHSVEGEQDVLDLHGVIGRRDAVIDGCVLDVKSANSRSFRKFQDGTLNKEDRFGYLDTLDGYCVASMDDPLVITKDKGYLLAVDKELGKMVLYEHHIRERHIRRRVEKARHCIEQDTPPPCECGTEPHQGSGHIKLDDTAKYNNFKFECFPKLRTFLYSGGPVYLTYVNEKRKPDVPELDRYGNYV